MTFLFTHIPFLSDYFLICLEDACSIFCNVVAVVKTNYFMLIQPHNDLVLTVTDSVAFLFGH